MEQKRKGRTPVQFTESEIFDILSNIHQEQKPISSYYLKKFSDMGYIKIGLEKLVEGRGRRRKTYSLTEAGKDFLTNYQSKSEPMD